MASGARDRFPDHRGKATWGDRVVPLETFRDAAKRSGRELSREQRGSETRRFLERPAADLSVEGPFSRVVVFGGVYNNHLALAALLDEAATAGAEAIYCLGDLGGFGPNPEKVRPLLDQGGVKCIQGNYEQSLAGFEDDCNCGYTDPRDNHFARLSYEYTARRTDAEFRSFMAALPERRRVGLGRNELTLVHGSPRRVNEFLFHSTTPAAYLEVLLDQANSAGLLCTHTGLEWHRKLPSGRDAINVGVIGRPPNDGRPEVRYCLLEERGRELSVELRSLRYDHQGLAAEMRREEIPEEFVATILEGWWTTCLEILPARERAGSKF